MGLIGKPKLYTKFEIASFSQVAQLLKGNSKFFEAPWRWPCSLLPFAFRCGFLIGLGKPKLYTKFKFTTFSHYRDIKKDPQILGSFRTQSYAHFFFWCDFMLNLGKPQWIANFEVASFSRCRNIKGKSTIMVSSPSSRPRPFFSGCDFMMFLGKPELRAKFEVASFSRCRSIKGGPQNFRELP